MSQSRTPERSELREDVIPLCKSSIELVINCKTQEEEETISIKIEEEPAKKRMKIDASARMNVRKKCCKST